jgi:hypothetical protein
MKKLFGSFIVIFYLSNAWGQDVAYYSNGGTYTTGAIDQWYLNLEKYWYYRYRLVNDFMKMGYGMGDNMIAYQRIKGDIYPLHSNTNANTLDFEGDQTNDLGTYLAVLGLEYKMLRTNGFSAAQTLREIQYAQNAYDRLRKNSVDIYAHMPTTYGYFDPVFAAPPPTLITTDITNGFFIRDDVPYWDYIYQSWAPAAYNNLHFNRPALVANPDKRVNYCLGGSLNGSYYGDNPANPSSVGEYPTPIGSFAHANPTSESQDQMNQIYLGEQSLIQNLDASDPVAAPLKIRAENALFHTMSYLEHHEGSPFLFYSIPDPTNPCCACVNSSCSGAGFFYPSSLPAMYGLHGWLAAASSSWSSAANSLQVETENVNSYYVYGLYMQTDAFCCDYRSQNIVYADGFSCYGPELALMVPCPIPSSSPLHWLCSVITPGIDYAIRMGSSIEDKKYYTWEAIKRHAWDFHFDAPHLPLIFELNYEDRGWVHHGDVEGLLNSAPPCGPYCYENAQHVRDLNGGNQDVSNLTGLAYYPGSGTDWNGNSRLTDANHRQGLDCYAWTWGGYESCRTAGGYDADFNGLDYMWLFNLFAMERSKAYSEGAAATPYLMGMMNSYYCENFSVAYPDGGGIGSYSNKLKLNWLEYISAIDVINGSSSPAGWLDFRGAQVIDLKPGFHAEHGCFFLAHIKDYSCSGGDNLDSAYNFAQLNPSTMELMPVHAGGDTARIDTGWRDIEYLPWGTPRYVENLHPFVDTTAPPEPDYNRDWQTLLITHKDEIIEFINNLKQSPELQNLLGINIDSININDVNAILFPDSLSVDLYPNPTNGVTYLAYSLMNPNSVSITMSNTLGQDLSFLIDHYDTDAQPGQYKVTLNTDKIAPGLYYVTIKIGRKMITKKISVIN